MQIHIEVVNTYLDLVEEELVLEQVGIFQIRTGTRFQCLFLFALVV